MGEDHIREVTTVRRPQKVQLSLTKSKINNKTSLRH